MLSVLDGPLSERLGMRVPDVRQLAMRDWRAFQHYGNGIVSGERAMPDVASGVHACAMMLGRTRAWSYWAQGETIVPSWRLHVGIIRQAIIRMLDYDGDAQAAARDSDLAWCIQAHAKSFEEFVQVVHKNVKSGHIASWLGAEKGLLRKVFSNWVHVCEGLQIEAVHPLLSGRLGGNYHSFI